jgi:hypothetical protein
MWPINRLEILYRWKKIYTFGGQKGIIDPRAQKRNFGPRISMIVWYIHRSEILHRVRKNILLGVKKSKISLQSPKTEFGLQNQYDHIMWHIHRSEILHGVRKNILLGVKKAKKGFRAQKLNFGPKISIVYPAVIWHSFTQILREQIKSYLSSKSLLLCCKFILSVNCEYIFIYWFMQKMYKIQYFSCDLFFIKKKIYKYFEWMINYSSFFACLLVEFFKWLPENLTKGFK